MVRQRFNKRMGSLQIALILLNRLIEAEPEFWILEVKSRRLRQDILER